MDLETATLEIRARIGEDIPDFWSPEEVIRKVNEAQKRFCSEERWSWLLTMSSVAVVPEDQGEWDNLEVNVDYTRQFDFVLQPSSSTSARDLVFPKRVSSGEGIRLRKEYAEVGAPRFFYLVQTVNTAGSFQPTIRFIPEPDQDYKAEFYYYRLPTDVAVDADTLDVPEQYVEAVVSWATANLWLKELPGGVKAQEQFNIYNTVLEQARRDEDRLADDETFVIGGAEPQNTSGAQDPVRDWVFSRVQGPLG